MTTRAEFRSVLRETLTDRAIWPDTLLNIWINNAIQDYSNYFPRRAETTLACVAAQRVYSLTALSGIQGILAVEYPKDESPPRYLARRPETGSFLDLPVYDVRGDPPLSLVIGESPAAAEEIWVAYACDHTTPSTDSTALTVPDKHLEALKLFVIWQAVRELELTEAADRAGTEMLLSLLGLNSVRAERLYRNRIDDYAKKAAAPGGYAGPWVADDHDRIY